MLTGMSPQNEGIQRGHLNKNGRQVYLFSK